MQRQAKLPLLLLASLIFWFPNIIVANNPWKLINEDEIDATHLNRPTIPNKYLTFHLAMESLQTILTQAPLRFAADSHKKQVVLEIPMPNGEMERFQIQEAPIMHPDLARKYPLLHSYVGAGIDDPTASLRFDLTPFGFHAMILSGRHGGVFIDPYAQNDTQHYIVYYQKDLSKDTQFKCYFSDNEDTHSGMVPSTSQNIQGDCMLRTYRLALACTGEYADFHGGTKASVMAAFHTTMTRVNGIFERDAAINLELIANTDELIFLDAATDPYTTSFPTGNQAVCDDIIGSANYDIGHLLGIGDGGSAERSSCCVEGLKAEGYSTLASPVGDGFDINFVSHEFGHQFGCSHTASATCNNTPSTSVEPGNAYTVMGFDFFCDPIIEDVRGAYFHAINILEITENIINGPAGSCATITDPGNTPPSVDGGNTHYYLPVSTPFKLTAEGNDIDGDALTFCWEQMDNEEVVNPPVPTNTAGPAFRSYDPAEAPFRYFPAIEYIVDGTDYLWEVLPGVSRVMNFRVTARDNFPGGGCTDIDDVDLTFTETAGPFLVEKPNVNETWYQDALYTVSWDVANTDKEPVSCAEVDLLLSLDGGYTYPIILATEVANDGSHVITAPQVSTSMARVMVICSDNIFFDISDENFSIEVATAPSLTMAINPPKQEVCGITENGNYTLSFSSLGGFNEEITLDATGIPSGAVFSFSENPVIPPKSVDLILDDLENVVTGSYTITITAATASTTIEQEVSINVNNDLPDMINLTSPIDGATNELLLPAFSWEEGGNTNTYIFEIATDAEFGNSLIERSYLNENNYILSKALEPLTVYYWRVLPESTCIESAEEATVFSFQTSGEVCKQYTNVEPAYIQGFLNSITSTITIEEDYEILDANISMEIYHKLVGDLKASLTSPSGITIELFNRPGVTSSNPFGCTRDDMLVTFDDETSSTSDDFHNTCISGTDYAIEGAFQPINALSALNGQSSLGDWVLTVSDEKFSHAGAIDSWSLEFCLDAGGTSGSSQPDSKLNFNLFPNPASNNITLALSQPTSSRLRIMIYDVIGNLHKEITMEKTAPFFQQQIDLHDLPAGSYLILLRDSNTIGRQLFIKH